MTIMLELSDSAGARRRPQATEDDVDVVHIGAHTLRLEGPDLFLMDVIGGVSAAEMAALVDGINRFAEGKTGVFGITNLIHLGSVSTDARRHLLRIAPLSGGIAYIGVKLQMRVGFTALNALRSKRHKGVDTPITFVTTEQEAWQWVSKRRRDLEGEPGSRRANALLWQAAPGDHG